MQKRIMGKTGVNVSVLGFGAMRFPTIQNEEGKTVINEEQAIHMLRYAIDQGVNYVDTAYPYHEGQSEILVGKALKDGYREKTFIATKSPVWAIKKEGDFERILEEQLHKLDVEYIDFYLLHALNLERFNNVVLKFDLINKMKEAKEKGIIRHMGFSFHDNSEAFRTIVDSTDAWDFCQIQMNYIDINNQATIKGMEYAASKGMGIIIMEPLLGGKLANPPKNVANVLDNSKSPVEWALDFLWNRPEVSIILSGMSDMQQTKDNIVYANRSSVDMLREEELSMLSHAKEIYETMALVSCTKCEYCMPCPFGLQIPKTFEAYNKTATSGMEEARNLYNSIEVKADSCQKCHMCEEVCPQGIKISEVMETIALEFVE